MLKSMLLYEQRIHKNTEIADVLFLYVGISRLIWMGYGLCGLTESL